MTDTDVLIVGGGLAGLTMALALASGGVRTTVVERAEPAAMRQHAFDGRTSAIAYGSAKIFDGIGVWSALTADAQPILDIRVADGNLIDGVSPLFLHYDHRDVGSDPMGYILENKNMRNVLFDAVEAADLVTLIAPASIEDVDRGAYPVRAKLADGRTITAALVIGADGRNSPMRRLADIKAAQFRYDQTSIVCTVTHERPHNGVAVELFLPGGPFAMLPMTGNRTNIVWSENTELAETLMALDDAEFAAELSRRFGEWLGGIELTGPRFKFPLGLLHAERYIDKRLALVGDAAHAIHPIAGQGFNMGLRDIAALAEIIVDAKRLGLDIGAADQLARYQRWRRFDNTLLATVTDGLTRLFSNDIPPVRLARDLGLAAVGKVPPLRRFFIRHAMGVVGDLPRLVRGEPL